MANRGMLSPPLDLLLGSSRQRYIVHQLKVFFMQGFFKPSKIYFSKFLWWSFFPFVVTINCILLIYFFNLLFPHRFDMIYPSYNKTDIQGISWIYSSFYCKAISRFMIMLTHLHFFPCQVKCSVQKYEPVFDVPDLGPPEQPKPPPPKNDITNRFWAYVEQYCQEITVDDIKVSLLWNTVKV